MKKSFTTDANGVPHIDATDARDMFRQLGVIHATERSVQMILMRILGQGRGSELLDSSDMMLGIDTFFRRMNWTKGLAAEILKLSAAEQAQLAAYCDGINSVLLKKTPWEFKLVGYRFEPWLHEIPHPECGNRTRTGRGWEWWRPAQPVD